MPDTPLNPDGVLHAMDTLMAETDTDERATEWAHKVTTRVLEGYFAVAQPVAQKLTDAEWQAFQAIPDQGYSHRAWVDARIAERVAVAQPEVNSVEELDQLPHETVIRDSKDLVFERIALPGQEPEWWSTTEFLNETEVSLPARVLYRPEVKP
ncbi:hypothetical protein [Glutamicibacter protophormiae]|uniref:hypothetical protein n=1 Tax=Glutamicibacter protophormiae TaxID=37930 RepID=UPI00195802DF|nr:hypothetical protein [Glutamicibacter protophormiae]QRQ79146.1 hypothetical protein JQN66_02515 [Glutamicibacter protophormiae]